MVYKLLLRRLPPREAGGTSGDARDERNAACNSGGDGEEYGCDAPWPWNRADDSPPWVRLPPSPQPAAAAAGVVARFRPAADSAADVPQLHDGHAGRWVAARRRRSPRGAPAAAVDAAVADADAAAAERDRSVPGWRSYAYAYDSPPLCGGAAAVGLCLASARRAAASPTSQALRRDAVDAATFCADSAREWLAEVPWHSGGAPRLPPRARLAFSALLTSCSLLGPPAAHAAATALSAAAAAGPAASRAAADDAALPRLVLSCSTVEDLTAAVDGATGGAAGGGAAGGGAAAVAEAVAALHRAASPPDDTPGDTPGGAGGPQSEEDAGGVSQLVGPTPVLRFADGAGWIEYDLPWEDKEMDRWDLM